MNAPRPLPITVVSGWDDQSRVALSRALQKQMPTHHVVDNNRTFFLEDLPQSTHLNQGCACCNARTSLQDEALRIARETNAPGLLLCTREISEPVQISHAFLPRDLPSALAANFAQIQALWTSVLVDDFLDQMKSPATLQDLKLEASRADWRSLPGLLVKQVEFSNVIVLDHRQSDPQGELSLRTEAFVRQLNPAAMVLRSLQGDLLPHTPFEVTFKAKAASRAQGWLCAIREEHPTAWTFRARRPFHPERLHAWLTSATHGPLRVKGFAWIASQTAWNFGLSKAGAHALLQPTGTWWAERPKEERPNAPAAQLYLESIWREPWGDRRQELGILAPEHSREDIESTLAAALLNEEEMALGVLGWKFLRDPFGGPEWESTRPATDLATIADTVKFQH